MHVNSKALRTASQVCFVAGIASIGLSAVTFLINQRNAREGRRNPGVFTGLWAPTFFSLADLLDRVAIDENRYLGVTIDRNPIRERAAAMMNR